MTFNQDRLREALRQWKCPSCGGAGHYSGYSKEAPEGQKCQKCNGDGLHPAASAALAAAPEVVGGEARQELMNDIKRILRAIARGQAVAMKYGEEVLTELEAVTAAQRADAPVPATPMSANPQDYCPACGSGIRSMRGEFAVGEGGYGSEECSDAWHESPIPDAALPSGEGHDAKT